MNYLPVIAHGIRIFIRDNKWRAEKWTEKDLHECSEDINLQLRLVENRMIKDESKGFEIIKRK